MSKHIEDDGSCVVDVREHTREGGKVHVDAHDRSCPGSGASAQSSAFEAQKALITSGIAVNFAAAQELVRIAEKQGHVLIQAHRRNIGTLKDPLMPRELQYTADAVMTAFLAPGMGSSRRMLRHFLHGKGADFYLTSQEMRDSRAYNEGIRKNKERFENSLMEYNKEGGKNTHAFIAQIKGMKEGETITLVNPSITDKTPIYGRFMSDLWDDDIGNFEGFWRRDPNQSLSIGSVKLRSMGIFTATRRGDIIEVRGKVEHGIDNIYDFNNITFVDRNFLFNFRRMQEQGYATPFRVQGTVKQDMVAKIEVKDGKIVSTKFTWTDIK